MKATPQQVGLDKSGRALNVQGAFPADAYGIFYPYFPDLPIVCTHRVPDEEMWMAALEAGASDVCPTDDVENVLTSVLRSTGLSRSAA